MFMQYDILICPVLWLAQYRLRASNESDWWGVKFNERDYNNYEILWLPSIAVLKKCTVSLYQSTSYVRQPTAKEDESRSRADKFACSLAAAHAAPPVSQLPCLTCSSNEQGLRAAQVRMMTEQSESIDRVPCHRKDLYLSPRMMMMMMM